MSRRRLKNSLSRKCEIYRLVENRVPGNAPATKHEKIPGDFSCLLTKNRAYSGQVMAETMVGNVPIGTYTLLLDSQEPNFELAENYRVRIEGLEYTVHEVLPIYKRRGKRHHTEAIVRKRS